MTRLTWFLFTFVFCQVGFGKNSSTSFSAFVKSNSYQIDYETFVHLPQAEKREVMEMLQDYMIIAEQAHIDAAKELEKKQSKKKTTWYERNPVIKFLIEQGPIITDAYARRRRPIAPTEPRPERRAFEDGEYTEGRNPHSISGTERQFLCMYAGWFSSTSHLAARSGSRGSGICSHPSSRKRTARREESTRLFTSEMNTIQDEYTRLMRESQSFEYFEVPRARGRGSSANPIVGPTQRTACRAPSAIICNPEIFGTASSGAPFCVQGNSRSINSSVLCAYAVDNLKASDLPAYNAMMDRMIQENLQNDTRRRRFTDSLLSMYDTCMCQGTSSYLSPAYADKIFGDRTCYGLLFQSRNILSRITSQQASCSAFSRIDYIPGVASLLAWARAAQQRLDRSLRRTNAAEDARIDFSGEDDSNFRTQRQAEYQAAVAAGECPLRVSPRFVVEAVEGDPIIRDGKAYKKFRGFIVGITDQEQRDSSTGRIPAPISAVTVTEPSGFTASCEVNQSQNNEFLCERSLTQNYTVSATTNSRYVAEGEMRTQGGLTVERFPIQLEITIAPAQHEPAQSRANFTATVTASPNTIGLDPSQYTITWCREDEAAGDDGNCAQQSGDRARPTGHGPQNSQARSPMVDQVYNIKAFVRLNNVPDVKDDSEPAEVPERGTPACSLALNAEQTNAGENLYAYTYTVQLPDGVDSLEVSQVSWTPNATRMDAATRTAFFNIPNPAAPAATPPATTETPTPDRPATAEATDPETPPPAGEQAPAQEGAAEGSATGTQAPATRPEQITASITFQGRERPVECSPAAVPAPPAPTPTPPAVEPPEEEPETPSYTITLRKRVQGNACVVEAEVKRGDEVVSAGQGGTNVTWFVQTANQYVTDREPARSPRNGGIQQIEDESEESAAQDIEAPSGFEQSGTGQAVTVPKLDYNREAFAVLSVAGQDNITSSSVTCEKIQTPTQLPSGNPRFIQPPPPPPRRPSGLQVGGGLM